MRGLRAPATRRRDNNLERKETVVEQAEEEEGRGGEGPALSNDKTTIILVTRDIAAGRLCLDPERPSRESPACE